jgi:eukaryotic-like serine/threonine-protein kinase
MIGQTLGHYRIDSKLGEGGMGLVYRARDLHLDREVAIKVLPTETVADPERKRRFAQEAKAASALNHPNILHIYDISAQDGVDFIAMEYVKGETLAQHIGRKALPLQQTLKYASQIADALTTAHRAGIIHRDIKPSNLIVSDKGVVKVLDFGLAKLIDSTEPDPGAATESMKADSARQRSSTMSRRHRASLLEPCRPTWRRSSPVACARTRNGGRSTWTM